MNAQQTAYKIAKAVYETVVAEKSLRLAPYDAMLDNSDDDFEAYTVIEMNIHAELDIDAHAKNLRTAEDALIDWAMGQVGKVAFIGEEQAAISTVKARLYLPSVRAKVLDAAFMLAAK